MTTGGKKVVHSWTKEDGAVTGRTSGSQFARNSSDVEINDIAEENPVFLGMKVKCEAHLIDERVCPVYFG